MIETRFWKDSIMTIFVKGLVSMMGETIVFSEAIFSAFIYTSVLGLIKIKVYLFL